VGHKTDRVPVPKEEGKTSQQINSISQGHDCWKRNSPAGRRKVAQYSMIGHQELHSDCKEEKETVT
jgi:hypothetical protein